MTKRDGLFWFKVTVLALAVVAMVLSIVAATERSITITRAEILAKLVGKPSPHKFDDLKKQEARIEARLGGLEETEKE